MGVNGNMTNEDVKKEIMRMVDAIDNNLFLMRIYYFVKVKYKNRNVKSVENN